MEEIFVKERNLDNFIFEDNAKYLFEEGEYSLSISKKIGSNCELVGNKTIFKGIETNKGLIIYGSNTKVSGIKFKSFIVGVEINGEGSHQENICLSNLDIDVSLVGIQAGSSKSNRVTKNILIDNCVLRIVTLDEWEETAAKAILPINASAGLGLKDDVQVIENCLLENFTVSNCKIFGQCRCAFNIVNGVNDCLDLFGIQKFYKNCIIKNVNIVKNYAECCWDSPFNIVSEFFLCQGSVIEELNIEDNELGFGISGCYLYACEPFLGGADGGRISKVRFVNNKLKRVVADVGEPTRGVSFAAVRADTKGQNIKNCILEDLEVSGNTFDGAGPEIAAVYAMTDTDNCCENNCIRNIRIRHNTIKNTDYAFTFAGAECEGRIYDWNFGYPRHDKRWDEDIKDDSTITSHLNNNYVKDVVCEDNVIEGYRYRVCAAGANLRGHGEATGNKVSENIIFRNNKYGVGENHIRVADFIGEDFVRDFGNNEVSKEFLKK